MGLRAEPAASQLGKAPGGPVIREQQRLRVLPWLRKYLRQPLCSALPCLTFEGSSARCRSRQRACSCLRSLAS